MLEDYAQELGDIKLRLGHSMNSLQIVSPRDEEELKFSEGPGKDEPYGELQVELAGLIRAIDQKDGNITDRFRRLLAHMGSSQPLHTPRSEAVESEEESSVNPSEWKQIQEEIQRHFHKLRHSSEAEVRMQLYNISHDVTTPENTEREEKDEVEIKPLRKGNESEHEEGSRSNVDSDSHRDSHRRSMRKSTKSYKYRKL
jgi:hypothetical protein